MIEATRLESEGRRLVEEAAAQSLVVRLLGGMAFWMRADDRGRSLLGREYKDLDFAAIRAQSGALRRLMEASGYVPERQFNAIHGAKRLLYYPADGAFQMDIFLSNFSMCHELKLADRLEIEPLTLPAAELLLTKLQIVELNSKDVADVLMMLLEHHLADTDGAKLINAKRIVQLCCADWGLYTTVNDNLARIGEQTSALLAEGADSVQILGTLTELRQRLETAPKSLGWRARARVGRTVRWYELPEEVAR